LSRNLGTLTYWNPLGHSRPVTGLLYLYINKLHLLDIIFCLIVHVPKTATKLGLVTFSILFEKWIPYTMLYSWHGLADMEAVKRITTE